MDLSLGDRIDTVCACGGDAEGYVFGPDGARRYVCSDCAEDLLRTGEARFLSELADHPRGRRCRRCERLTLLEGLDVRGVCADCQGERAEQENQQVVDAIAQDQAEQAAGDAGSASEQEQGAGDGDP